MDRLAIATANLFNLATPGGLEPPTFSLEGCCSIQLSYGAPRASQDPAAAVL